MLRRNHEQRRKGGRGAPSSEPQGPYLQEYPQQGRLLDKQLVGLYSLARMEPPCAPKLGPLGTDVNGLTVLIVF